MTVSHETNPQFTQSDLEELVASMAFSRGVTLKALRGKSRSRKLVEARKAIARRLTDLGYISEEIGLLINRERSVISHYLNWVAPKDRLSVTCPTDAKSNERSR